MKLQSAKSAILPKPWVDDDKIRLETLCDQDMKITAFRVTDKRGKVVKEFKVVRFDVLKAWKQTEKCLDKLV